MIVTGTERKGLSMTRRFALFAGAALAACAPATAQTPVALERFDEIELRGGGSVTIRQGAEQRVTMLRGDPSLTRFRVEGDRLTIDACIRSCRDYDLAIEIVVPEIDAVAIQGGGSIRARAQVNLVAAVQGGGSITYWGDPQVVSNISGGGSIRPGQGG